MSTCEKLLPLLRSDFGKLWHCRPRGESVEVVTPFCTVTDRFVSVFITERDGAFVVSDGGCLESEQNNYGVETDSDIWEGAIEALGSGLGISRLEQVHTTFYYKRVERVDLLSAAVFDVCNFVCAAVSAITVSAACTEESKQKDSFRSKANSFLKANFPEANFGRRLDDLQGATFSAILTRGGQLSLVSYVTGTTASHFSRELKGAVVNFQLAEKSRYRDVIRSRVALLNNEASGYNPSGMQGLIEHLAENSSHAPVNWTQRNELLSLV